MKSIEQMIFQPLPTDRIFNDSPAEGKFNCYCSRCGEYILGDEAAVRFWPTENKNFIQWKFHLHTVPAPPEFKRELRFHYRCIFPGSSDESPMRKYLSSQ